VVEGVTGYLVAPGDPAALTAAVAALAADPAARARFSAAARRQVLGRTWSALTDELIDHYDTVVNDAAKAAPAARLAA
jgi:phosphatidylinositol alpha 1,6-mannosyltransferase